MKPLASLKNFGLILLLIGSVFRIEAKLMDNGVDPANLGKGEWIYVLSTALNHMGGNVPSVTDLTSMMSYLKSQGVNHLIVKAGTGADDYYYPSGNLQFSTSLVNAAHAAGIKIFGYTRSDGIDVPGEIALAARVYNKGADGFVIDAEIEWEAANLPDNYNKATQLASGIKAQFPNKFLGHSPFWKISVHSTFPYKEFGYYCDAVMPQDYWYTDTGRVTNPAYDTPQEMVAQMDIEWRNWQNSLSGQWTNSIKPLCPAGSAWNSTMPPSEITDFVNALKTSASPATRGGYHGVNYWRAELHTADMWSNIGSADIGTSPVILIQPKGATITNTSPTNVIFKVEAVGGIPLGYQWRFNGVAIPGATNTSYTINNVQYTNAGNYSVFITNYLGSLLSSSATLTMRSPPLVVVPAASISAVVGDTANFAVTATGTAPLSYQWRFNGTDISGATTNTYTRNNVALSDGGEYSVRISNAVGAVTNAATLSVVAARTPPLITAQPQPQTVIAGNNVTLSTAASGTGPFTYQWKRNGSDIAGATGSVCTITSAQPANAGTYSVVVGNAAGTDISSNAVLTVNYALNLTINGGGNVTKSPSAIGYAPNTIVTLTPVGSFSSWSGDATGSANPLSVTMNANKNISASFNAVADIVIDNPAATVIGTWSTGTGGTPYGTDYRWKSQGSGAAYLQFTPTIVYAGQYRVQTWYVAGANRTVGAPYVVNYSGGTQTVNINQEVSGAQWNNVGLFNFAAGTAGYVRITDGFPDAGQVVIADAIRFVHAPLPLITAQPQSRTNVSGSTAVFTVEAARATGYQWRFNGTAINGATSSICTRTNVQSADVGNYSVVVSGDNGSVTSSNAALTVNSLPSISVQPQSQTLYAGQSATFSVTGSGTAPIAYQWRFAGVNIEGATASTYTRSGIQPTDTGDYSVVLENAYGAAVSTNARLSLRQPPAIVTDPTNKTINCGGTATFAVDASGDGPLSYQWQHEGTNILGATTTSYTVINAQPEDAGNYVAIVSNSAGPTSSEPGYLTVNVYPTITSQPTNQTVVTGDMAVFVVVATGSDPISYQWRFNNNVIAGATDNAFTILSATKTNGGSYSVDVWNVAGFNNSSPVTLTVKSRPTEFESVTMTPGQPIHLVVTSEPGATNIVETSTTLTNWSAFTNFINTNGTKEIIDATTNLPLRFYRAR